MTNQKEQLIFGAEIILNIKVIKIEIRDYQLKNIFIKLDHT